MRKSVGILFCFSLVFSLSLSLTAQSNHEELDQKELMKQFTGNWVTNFNEATVMKFHVKPAGDGYQLELVWERDGEPDHIDRGVMGLDSDNSICEAWLWSNDGSITCDYGNFTSETFMTSERHNSLNEQVHSIFEFEFIAPGKMKMVHKWGVDGPPDEAGQSEFIWTKE